MTPDELLERLIDFAARVGKVVDAQLLDECSQLCNIIGQSIVTAKANKESKAAGAGLH